MPLPLMPQSENESSRVSIELFDPEPTKNPPINTGHPVGGGGEKRGNQKNQQYYLGRVAGGF